MHGLLPLRLPAATARSAWQGSGHQHERLRYESAQEQARSSLHCLGEEIFEEDEEWRFLQYIAPPQACSCAAQTAMPECWAPPASHK